MNWDGEADRLERLASDLRILAANGDRPTFEQLLSAPTLSDWRQTVVLTHALSGVVEGHPRIRPGLITTSAVFAQGPEWARTLSRFYRLPDRD